MNDLVDPVVGSCRLDLLCVPLGGTPIEAFDRNMLIYLSRSSLRSCVHCG